MKAHLTCQCDIVGCDDTPEIHLCVYHGIAATTKGQADLVHALEYARDYLDGLAEDLVCRHGEWPVSPLALSHAYQKVCRALGDDHSLLPPIMEKHAKYKDLERYVLPAQPWR